MNSYINGSLEGTGQEARRGTQSQVKRLTKISYFYYLKMPVVSAFHLKKEPSEGSLWPTCPPVPITTEIVSFFLIKQLLRVGLEFNHQAWHWSYGKMQSGILKGHLLKSKSNLLWSWVLPVLIRVGHVPESGPTMAHSQVCSCIFE